MKRFIKLTIIFVLGIVFGLNAAGQANAADCIPQNATQATFKDVPNPDYVAPIPAWTEQVLVTPERYVEHATEPKVLYPAGSWVPPVVENIFHETEKHLEKEYRNKETGELKWVVGHVVWQDPCWELTGNKKWVVDKEAWTETITVKEGYYTDVDILVPGGEGETYTVTIPAVYKTVEHPEVPAVGEPTLRVPDAPAKDAVVCAEVINVDHPQLAATGPERMALPAGIALALIGLGTFAVIVSRKKKSA